MPPPVAPRPASGNDDDWYDGQPIGLGPRVPMTVVSPWTVGGHVNSQVFDHTSVIRFLERWTGVREPNISSWRRTACGDLTSAFDFDRSYRQPKVDTPGAVPAPIARWKPTPPVDQAVPLQEPGRRPARRLPYRPAVSGFGRRWRAEDCAEQRRQRAVHFAIYPYGGELPRARHHRDVRRERAARSRSRVRIEIAVQGPNRFWVELAGSTDGVAAGLDVRV